MSVDTLPGTRALTSRAIIATVFAPFAAGYFLSYLFRTINAVIADDLTLAVGLSTSDLGMLTAVYFIALAALQLPLGILLDRYGARRVNGSLLLLAAAGSIVFAIADSITGFLLGRAMIGFGVAAGLVAAFKANVDWWPPERLPLMNSLFVAAGGIGAWAATSPAVTIMTLIDWRSLFLCLAGLTVAIAIIILVVVPDPIRSRTTDVTLREQIRSIGMILGSSAFWRLAPVNVIVQGTAMAYIGLWAAQWLTVVEGMDRSASAQTLQALPIALVVGSAGWGILSETMRRMGIGPEVVMFTGIGFLGVAMGWLAIGLPGPPFLLWAAVILFGTVSIFGYALLSQVFPVHLAGRVNTALNLMVFCTAFAVQYGVGLAIERSLAIGLVSNEADAHRLILGLLGGLTVTALAWAILPRRRCPNRPRRRLV